VGELEPGRAKPPQLGENFEAVYANNVRYEASVWDLKLIFGQLDLMSGFEVIKLHTAVTMPWAAAKLMAYWLKLNIDLYELENGPIMINSRMLPPEPAPPEQESELMRRSYDLAVRSRLRFIAEQGTSVP